MSRSKSAVKSPTLTTASLLTESKNLLLKQKLRLQLNLNANDMMIMNCPWTNKHQQNIECLDGNETAITAKGRIRKMADEIIDDNDQRRNATHTSPPFENQVKVVNKLDTVTTVPQQQHRNKFNIKSTMPTTAVKSTTTTVVVNTEKSISVESLNMTIASAPLYNSSIPQTALAKFNRIIDDAMPITNQYYLQQPDTPIFGMAVSAQTRSQPFLSINLRKRLATQYSKIVTNNSLINSTISTATGTTVKANTTNDIHTISTPITINPRRNDVHYLLKQLNSFSDIEEIEIADMKQRQRQENKGKQHNKSHFDNDQKYHLHHSIKKYKRHPLRQNEIYRDICDSDDLWAAVTKSHEKKLPSPSATSLVLYSPSSQSHKGIRRYASLHQPNECSQPHALPYQHIQDHYYHHHQHQQDHHPYPRGRTCIAQMADVAMLKQFVDDYIFQSCHYLETSNFSCNYRTTMVESSSHEFRPSVTTITLTSELENGTGYDDASLIQSRGLRETVPPKAICTEETPHLAVILPRKQYKKETPLCSSGIQTDFNSSSIAQSSTLSNSEASSSSSRMKCKSLFKCCYTSLDKWRKKRLNSNSVQSLKTSTIHKHVRANSPMLVNTNVAIVGTSGKELSTTSTITTIMTTNIVPTTTPNIAFGHAKNIGHPV